jgi:4'-phosphopantetheinyl transferase EntD
VVEHWIFPWSDFAHPIDLIRADSRHQGVVAAVRAEAYTRLAARPGDLFCEAELAEWHALTYQRRKSSYLLGRYAAKRALSVHLKEADLARLEIRSGVFRQPMLRYPVPLAPGLSLAHDEMVAIAVAFDSEQIMGIDVEGCSADPSRLDAIASQITQSELDAGFALGLSYPEACVLLWTLKESLSKALRVGLTVPFNLLELSDLETMPRGNHFRALFKNFTQYQGQSWSLDDRFVSLALPRLTTLDLDLRQLWRTGGEQPPDSQA